jgi:hypothetical protein
MRPRSYFRRIAPTLLWSVGCMLGVTHAAQAAVVLRFDPPRVDFGDVAVGSHKIVNVSLTNVGTDTLSDWNEVFDPGDPSTLLTFARLDPDRLPPLPPGVTRTVMLGFQPREAGVRHASLLVVDRNERVLGTLPLMGRGVRLGRRGGAQDEPVQSNGESLFHFSDRYGRSFYGEILWVAEARSDGHGGFRAVVFENLNATLQDVEGTSGAFVRDHHILDFLPPFPKTVTRVESYLLSYGPFRGSRLHVTWLFRIDTMGRVAVDLSDQFSVRPNIGR